MIELKIMVIKMFTELGRKVYENSENFQKMIENIRKYQTEITSRLNQMEETIGQIKDIHMAGRYRRKCSTILITREIQSKPQ